MSVCVCALTMRRSCIGGRFFLIWDSSYDAVVVSIAVLVFFHYINIKRERERRGREGERYSRVYTSYFLLLLPLLLLLTAPSRANSYSILFLIWILKRSFTEHLDRFCYSSSRHICSLPIVLVDSIPSRIGDTWIDEEERERGKRTKTQWWALTPMLVILEQHLLILLANKKREWEKGIKHAQLKGGAEESIEYGCG